jgi:hypothetical protein
MTNYIRPVFNKNAGHFGGPLLASMDGNRGTRPGGMEELQPRLLEMEN